MHDIEAIFKIENQEQFEHCALDLFAYQFENNPVYRSFCDLLYIHPSDVTHTKQIPFLPIEFFKTHEVHTQAKTPELYFTSSGTTSQKTSKHYVHSEQLYQSSFMQGFKTQCGNPKDYVILALLPSYLERQGSSLIYMVDHLIKASQHPDSGFYLDNFFALSEKLKYLDSSGQKVLLIGVSFALLDLIDSYNFDLSHTLIMETGGMKGRRKELIRTELHERLKKGFGVTNIHSEYGMTELLSQAYSSGNGIFTTPPWMRVYARDTIDPFTILNNNKTGALSIIDLANRYSCPFIATKDLGRVLSTNTFTVEGRFDNSDIRGCNLLVL